MIHTHPSGMTCLHTKSRNTYSGKGAMVDFR